MPMRTDNLGVPVPFGSGSSDKEILIIDKAGGGSHICNVFPKGRFDLEEAAILTILESIGDGDDGTDNFLKVWTATSAGEGGLRVGEFIQLRTGMIAPSAMPMNMAARMQMRRDGHGTKQQKAGGNGNAEDNE